MQPPEPFGDAVLVETDVPCSIHRLAHMLFAQGSTFQQSWCGQLGATREVEGPWSFSTAPDGATPVASREVSLCTPPPAAWGYLVGNTPIPSRRRMVALRVRSGSEVLVEETTTLEMPFGSTFHTCVQYYMMAVNDSKTHLRVTFKLVFTRFAAMKAVLTTMVRGEHEKIFGAWQAALMADVAHGGGVPRISTGPVSPHAAAAGDEAQTPVGMLVAHAPQFAAVFGAGCLAGAALAVACAAVLHALPDAPLFQPAQRWSRLAESASSGVRPHSNSLFLVTVGRALLFARLQPVALAVALLILVLAALTLLRVSGADHLWASDMRRQRGGGAGGSGDFGAKSTEGRANGGQQNSAGAGGRSAAAGRQASGTAGAPAGRQRPLGDGVAAQAAEDSGDNNATAEPTPEAAMSSPGDPLRSSYEVAVPVPAPAAPSAPTPPRVVPGPVEAPSDVPTPLLKGVQRLLSKAGRDDAVADFTEVFSVLAGDILGKNRKEAAPGADSSSVHSGSAARPDGAALPSPGRSSAAGAQADDDSWAVEALHLPDDEARGAEVEWVFEHARFMPTLGWSHDYLLPTDRRRWSQFDTAASTDSLRELISLPSGWQWAEVWQKDMRGAGSGAVDSQGWAYAVDFPFLHSPPRPGDGRESTMRCVRRRRWVRVRKPVRQEGHNEVSSTAAAPTPLSPPVASPPPTVAPLPRPVVAALAAVAEEQAEDAAQGGWEVDLGEALTADATAAEQHSGHVDLAALLQRALHATTEQKAASPHASPDLVAALQAYLDAHGEGTQRRSPRRLSFEESMWALKTDTARMSISLPMSEVGAAEQPRLGGGGGDAAAAPGPYCCTKAQLAVLSQTAQVSTPERQPVWGRSAVQQAATSLIAEAETRVVGFALQQ